MIVVIQLDEGGDLNQHDFLTKEEALAYLEEYPYKAYLIQADELEIEDHT